MSMADFARMNALQEQINALASRVSELEARKSEPAPAPKTLTLPNKDKAA
jgi:prefoldin subunit 5